MTTITKRKSLTSLTFELSVHIYICIFDDDLVRRMTKEGVKDRNLKHIHTFSFGHVRDLINGLL